MARAAKTSKKKTRSRKKKGVISVNFEGVESGGGRPVPDGQYTANLHKIDMEEGQNSGEPYLHCVWKIASGKAAGATVHDNISLQPQSLWRFRTMLECMGLEVEEGDMDIDPADILGEECGVEVTNEDWEGRDRPRITGFLMAGDEEEEEEDGEEEEEDEEPEEEAPKKRRSRKKKEEPEEEEEDEEEDEEDEEEEEPEPKKKRGKGKAKKIRTGSKVKFQDEEGDWVKGVIVEMDDDTANIEDSSGDVWEVDLSEVEAA